MKNYKVAVTFMVSAETEIEADSLDDAINNVIQGELPPEDTWLYVDDSFQIDWDSTRDLNDPELLEN
jgi:hypothetical protein